MSFASLKKNSNSALDKLTEELTKQSSAKKTYEDDDDRFWKPTRDAAGNGSAIIRFLPSTDGEDIPWIREFRHSFKGPTGKNYYEKSLTMIGREDPVGEFNKKLWDLDTEEAKEQARKQKRNLKYVSNIYVISDPGNKENEGKVFLYRYGKKIFDKLNELMNPSFEGDEKVNPFDFWKGANFRLIVRQVDKYPNYDKSTFAAPSPLFEDDKKLEEVWKQQYKLQEFLDPSKFKTYEELKAKLNRVLGLDSAGRIADDDGVNYETEAAHIEKSAASVFDEQVSSLDLDDEDEDSFAAFQELADR